VSGDPYVLRVERLLPVEPGRVFAAWTDPALLRRWWAAEPDWSCAEAEADVQVGGRYRLSMRDTQGAVRTVVGEYLEIEPPHLLVYTWAWLSRETNAPGEATVVTVRFLPEGTATRVVLEQRTFAEAADRALHERGWSGCLDSLEQRVFAQPSVG